MDYLVAFGFKAFGKLKSQRLVNSRGADCCGWKCRCLSKICFGSLMCRILL